MTATESLWNGGLVLAALLGMANAAGAADVAGTRAIIDRGFDAQYSHIEALYKDIHSHPELGFQETRTAAKLAAEMRALGYEVTEGIGKTGIFIEVQGFLSNADGSVKHKGLDNHAMGTIFEELVRRFNEENNEEAGEHWTPRDVVRLMAKLIFLPIADAIQSGTYLLYDGACGTGGMLTIGEQTLQALARERGKEVATHLFGQEINAETYAICKADLLLQGEGQDADNIRVDSASNRIFVGYGSGALAVIDPLRIKAAEARAKIIFETTGRNRRVKC